MCGIVGFVTAKPGTDYPKRRNFMTQGLYFDAVRGEHSTGMGLLKKGGVEIYKRALNAPDFLRSTMAEAAFKDFDEVAVAIGHNRFSTHGATKDVNAHPFGFSDLQDITLVHNGTLNQYHSLTPPGFNHEVDSAHAAKALAMVDPKKANGELDVLNKLRGSFVLVWYNKTKNTFNIARNEFRDISYVRDKEGQIFFASEFGMLHWLMLRTGHEAPKQGWKYEFPDDNQWLEFPLDKLGAAPIAHKIEEIKTPVYPIYPQDNWRGRHYNQGGASGWNVRDSEVLRDLGFEVDEVVDCKLLDWESYSKGAAKSRSGDVYGFLRCETNDAAKIEIKAESVTDKDWKYLKKNFKDSCPIRIRTVRQETYGVDIDSWMIIGRITELDIKKAVEHIKAKKGNTWLEAFVKPKVIAKAITQASKDKNEEEEGLGGSLAELLPGPHGAAIQLRLWNEYVKIGCGWCQGIPKTEHADLIHWFPLATPPAFLCADCATDPDITDNMVIRQNNKGKH